ncbi:putative glyoxalase superfamily protein PhnB [Azospirillum lipoferum]|uniref:Bleomycin resistance protein n=1 Tax=Azospirillum lipoferum TaxID=193 RepID=A0A5A9GQK3_AZOLI|nr:MULTISPECIES: VOC family protein [Azospirillum]KAA0596761.1 VOC family protein [Azospirillum lipoferum]MCP1610789.1 putative glyoxalase superfamily protein PhnB [Azospirillum lipoferum]MDW5537767.1 VOC family protein [Azospirillum sp. NL1]
MTVQFERVAPILPVRDVRAALAHYWQLGFTVTAYDDDAADPVYGFLDWGGVSLHLTRVPDLDPERSVVACYLYVSDADALHTAWTAAKVGGRLTAVSDTPYGLREFAHIDPDGNLLRVGAEAGRDGDG